MTEMSSKKVRIYILVALLGALVVGLVSYDLNGGKVLKGMLMKSPAQAEQK
jgi:hypothetical protein